MVDAVNSLVNPDQYKRGVELMSKLRTYSKDRGELAKIGAAAKDWPSSFSGISILANRKTQEHRDNGGHWAWYDMLLTAGSYTHCTLDLPDLDINIAYPPRSLIALTGKTLKHAVPDWEGGDRICWAHFIRRMLLHKHQLVYPGWVQQQSYNDMLDLTYREL